jgi:DNA-binding NarL/FixJ family response regulator
MTRPTVILADDHQMVSAGLRGLLEPEFELVEIVEDGRQMVEAALLLNPDIIVADISMPLLNGLEALEQIRIAGCQSRIVFLTMHKDCTYAKKALQLGAHGYVLKHSAPEKLVEAIRLALVDRVYLSPPIEKSLQDLTNKKGDLVRSKKPLLTPRQREVLQLCAEGKTARQIGAVLQISVRTAEVHKAGIMRKLGASTNAELIKYALRHGIIGSE